MEQTKAGAVRRSATSDIVSAYVANNAIGKAELPLLIEQVYASVAMLETSRPAETRVTGPAVPARKSITPDFLISLEDGRAYKSLKRHLTRHGLTPQQYRRKWGLPYDYPMVAPNYAKRRAELARQIGLGSQARREPAAPTERPPSRNRGPRKAH